MFDRLINLIGENNFKLIKNKKVLLVGVGGVGGFTLEALVRSGIHNITIYDDDAIELSNLNRQIISSLNNIGNKKIDEAIKRAKSINNEINIFGYTEKISEKNIEDIGKFDYIIDACDDLKAKALLIKYALKNNIKIICALGTGKRITSDNIVIKKLKDTKNDPLARNLRKYISKEGLSMNIPVIYSEDLPMNNDKVISSSIFTPAIVGIKLANYVINDIIQQ